MYPRKYAVKSYRENSNHKKYRRDRVIKRAGGDIYSMTSMAHNRIRSITLELGKATESL